VLGVPTGIGLVVSNMIGAGVFVSAGFMAQDLGPGTILFAWAAGTLMALAGARAYAAVALLVPRSGGEYRYLSELAHPVFGYLSGWTSLLVGFAAPAAVSASAAGAFAGTLWPGLDHRLAGTALVLLFTAVHARSLALSKATQNALVVLKLVLLLGFATLGLAWGRAAWPSWEPPTPSHGFPLAAFVRSLFFVAFAFSGWNAAAYAAEEFREPRRDVPRAMLRGCALVAALYLMLNWVFVANLTPVQAAEAMQYETSRITLAHLVVRGLVGEAGARLMSLFVALVLAGATSAMTFAGPRVYAAMARDGFLPRSLAGVAGRPPAASIAAQGVLTVLLIYTHSVQQVLQNVGAILTLFSALTAACLFRVPRVRPDAPAVAPAARAAGALHVAFSAFMLYFGFRHSLDLLVWVGVVFGAGLLAYAAAARRRTRG
jgi:APA family basic amino acid/polyamine antiporter